MESLLDLAPWNLKILILFHPLPSLLSIPSWYSPSE
jgi:hypothetical protein